MIKINVKNFPDANFRNWLLEQDYATDGMLTEKMLCEITELDVRRCAIHSLTGIEHFTTLTKLNCNELPDFFGCIALSGIEGFGLFHERSVFSGLIA